tara:strand:- start:1040 stop:2464 length:1425 start_codon:yes stop_codon:yes gene_type:complete
MKSSYQQILFELLLSDRPLWVSLANSLLHLRVIETDRIETAATDGTALLINPAFFDSLKREQKKGLLMHEVMHVLFRHHDQYNDSGLTNHVVANYAMDDEINSVIAKWVSLPDGGTHPADIGCEPGLCWVDYYAPRMEWYNDQLKDAKDSQPDAQTGDSGADSQKSDNSDAGQETGDSGANMEPSSDGAETGDSGADSQGSDNSDAGQENGPSDGQSGAETGDSRVMDGVHAAGSFRSDFYPGEDIEDMPEVVGTAADLIADEFGELGNPDELKSVHVNRGVSRSRDHVCLNECTEETGLAGQQWQDVVIDALRPGGDRRIDWSRRSRRCQSQDSFMPGTKRRNGNSVALVVDCSGSCVDYFPLWVRLMNDLVESVTNVDRIEIVYHDTSVIGHDTWNRCEGPIEFKTLYGGGTSHRAVLNYVEGLDVDQIIQFTDCETDWPSEDPKRDCVTVIPSTGRAYYGCPFGINVCADV